jgi:hypothetical protein
LSGIDRFVLVYVNLFGFNLYLLILDVEAKVVVNTHVLIRHPDQRKEGNKVSPPIGIEQSKTGDEQKCRGNVVAEAVFAGKQIKKLPSRKRLGLLRFFLAIIPALPKHFLVSDRPGDASNGDSQKQQPRELETDWEHRTWMLPGRKPLRRKALGGMSGLGRRVKPRQMEASNKQPKVYATGHTLHYVDVQVAPV